MALTHGYNTLTTGVVHINNDQQVILSWRKYLNLLRGAFEKFLAWHHNSTMC